MKKVQLSILFVYLLWVGAFLLNLAQSPSLVVFSYLTFFQFFIPGLVLGLSFGLAKRPLTEIIFFSFILSYLVYLAAALPTLFFQVQWPIFVGLNVFLYLLVFAIFIIKSYKGLILKWIKPDGHEIFVVALGIFVLLSFTYINFRSDANQYNNRITSSRQSSYVETKLAANWIPDDDGELSREFVRAFHHDYKPYFSFLALPLKYSSVDQRYGWFIFTKLFIFLSIIGVYCFGRKLGGPICGHLALMLFMFTVFIVSFYYGLHNIINSGLWFAQAAYGRHVAENIFLLGFYLTIIEAFRNRERKSFLFAGLILLCMLSVHHFAFLWAAVNFFLFSIIVFFVSACRAKNFFPELKNFLKNNAYVAIPSVIFLLGLIVLSNYWEDVTYFATTIEENYPGYNDSIKRVTVFEQIRMLWDNASILFILSIVLGIPFLALRAIRKENIASQFLLSNIFLYVILKSPAVYNTLLVKEMGSVVGRLDGGLLFFIIIAFLIGCLVKRLKLKGTLLIYAMGLSAVIIFTIFGTDNSFAKELRYRKNAGYDFLRTTEYFKSIEKPSNDAGGFTVLTNLKTAVDMYAFFNAYTFQYKERLYWPLIMRGRKDLERLLYYPQEEDGKLIDLIDNSQVDYIIVPTEKQGMLTKKMLLTSTKRLVFMIAWRSMN